MIARIEGQSGEVRSMARAMIGPAMGWAALWLLGWVAICGTIALVDPDSIDPGDWEGLLLVMAPMGLLSGTAFLILTALASRGAPAREPSVRGAVMWGMLGTAIVQVGYLGHGDAGLAANLGMALMFSVFGGLVTIAWLLIGRRWSLWRSTRAARS